MILGGSMVSEVFVILDLRFRVQGEGIFLAQYGLSCLTVPWRFYSLGDGISQHATWVLPPAGEGVPGRQSQQMSTSASLFSLLFISLPDH